MPLNSATVSATWKYLLSLSSYTWFNNKRESTRLPVGSPCPLPHGTIAGMATTTPATAHTPHLLPFAQVGVGAARPHCPASCA